MIEINGYWEYRVVAAPETTMLCIKEVAFVPVARVRAAGDCTGIHFDPSSMNVKTVTTARDQMRVSLPVSKGMIKPLTMTERKSCLG